jgi:adenosylhomocysteine nucleosidase
VSAAQAHSIGVVAALTREARTLTRMPLTPGSPEKIGPHLLVCVSGLGPSRARTGAQALLASGASALMSWGLAGALVPDLKSGALILPHTVLAADAVAMSVDARWHERISQSVACDVRPIVHATGILSPSQKRALGESLSAAAADMESAVVARVAAEAGVPFLAVRAIADEVQDTVPGWLSSGLDAYGAVELRAFCLELVRHPLDVLSLFKLARAFSQAQDTLRRFRAQSL